MRTTQKTLIIAISTALLTTGVYAQVKDESTEPPAGPPTSEPLGAEGLPGQLCTESPGASGATCSPVIPTSGQTSSRFEVTGCAGPIEDVNIGLDVSHTWVGDLTITVRSPELTSVTIVDTVCGSGDNIFAVLDDAAATPVESGCGGVPIVNGTFRPSNPLSAINGEAGNGFWLLTIIDGAAGDGGQLNDWSVDLDCGGEPASRATFEVNKVFTDGNPGDVDVTLNCFTGLPITQTQTISESQNVVFIVTDFDDGQLDCNVTEADVTGYNAEYNNGTTTTSESCEYEDVVFGQAAECTITNTPIPVEVEVTKDWIFENSGGDEIDPAYKLQLHCDNEIVDGYEGYSGNWRKTLYNSSYNGTNDESYYALVVPDWDGGTQCWVDETVYDNSVEVDNDCGNLLLELAGGDSCTITNTVFYEGIPTLSNYGLALLTLMMLGVGFVGFRRFA